MMWYKNKKTRLDYILNSNHNVPEIEFVKTAYEKHFAIIIDRDKTHMDMKCTLCGKITKIKKNSKSYVCKCGYKHNTFHTKQFTNYNDRVIIKSELDGITAYFIAYITYENQMLIFEKPKLIAKNVYSPEKNKSYHFNLGYTTGISYYVRPNWCYRRFNRPSETEFNRKLSADFIYYTKQEMDIPELKYIKKNDVHILGYELQELIYNAYLIEILQKYKSSYLFNQLRNNTPSDKLQDLFNMRDINLSNKQLVKVVKHYAKNQDLEIEIYKDYIRDLRWLGYKLNDKNLIDNNYKARHIEMSKRIENILSRELDKKFIEKYSEFEDYRENGVVITKPKNPDDLIREGKELHHCVGNGRYAKDVAKGKTLILFVRLEKEKPYITAEIKDKKIKQFYGNNNQFVDYDMNKVETCRCVLRNYVAKYC